MVLSECCHVSHEDMDGLGGFRFHRQFIGNSLFTCSLTISRLHVYAICLHDNWSGGQNLAILEVLGVWYIIVHSDTMQRFVPNCASCPGYASQKRITEARLCADRFWTHNLLFGLWDALEFASPRSALEKRKWIEMGVHLNPASWGMQQKRRFVNWDQQRFYKHLSFTCLADIRSKAASLVSWVLLSAWIWPKRRRFPLERLVPVQGQLAPGRVGKNTGEKTVMEISMNGPYNCKSSQHQCWQMQVWPRGLSCLCLVRRNRNTVPSQWRRFSFLGVSRESCGLMLSSQ